MPLVETNLDGLCAGDAKLPAKRAQKSGAVLEVGRAAGGGAPRQVIGAFPGLQKRGKGALTRGGRRLVVSPVSKARPPPRTKGFAWESHTFVELLVKMRSFWQLHDQPIQPQGNPGHKNPAMKSAREKAASPEACWSVY